MQIKADTLPGDARIRQLRDEGVESMLRSLLGEYSQLRITALERGGASRTPLPAHIEAIAPFAAAQAAEFLFVQPDETIFVALFLKAVEDGVATAAIRFASNPDDFHQVYLVDLGSKVGAVLAIDAGPAALCPDPDQNGLGSITFVPRRGIRTINERGLILSVDDDLAAMLGYSSTELLGRPTLDLCHPDFHKVAIEGWIELLVQPDGVRRTRQRVQRGDGTWMWCELIHTNRLHDLGYVVNEMIDISVETEAESKLYQREQVLAQLTELLPSGVALFDHDGRVTFANARWAEIIGSEANHTSQFLRSISGDRNEVKRIETGLKSCMELGTQFSTRVEIKRPDHSTVRHCNFSARAFRDTEQTVTGLVCCLEDVTEIWRMSQELKERAETDGLTGLLNRPTIMEFLEARLEERSAQGTTTAVMFCDLNDFKLVNDLLGHAAGDLLLQEVAAYLRRSTRPGDLVGRLGGDEFVVVCPDVGSVDEIVALAARMTRGLAELDLPSVPGQPMTWSAGIASNGAQAWRAEELLALADSAMYEQKRAGSLVPLLYDEANLASTHRRVEIGRALPLAVADGALQVHYQSIVRLRTGETIGYEALARWCHNGSYIPPDEFIPLAEAKGLIADLGEWVLDQVLIEAAQATERRYWAVNVSPIQLREDRFADRVLAMMANRKVLPDSIVFEVTESTLIESSPTVMTNLMRLAEAGVRLAIDDFGAGYSSLHYLGSMPFGSVKIDRSFTAKLGQDPAAEAIVGCIADLGRRLGLVVLAEGVETAEQAKQARWLGVSLAQGYFYDRPSRVPLAASVTTG